MVEVAYMMDENQKKKYWDITLGRQDQCAKKGKNRSNSFSQSESPSLPPALSYFME